MYPTTNLRMNTDPAAWCGFEAAGALTTKLLLWGLFLGLVATGITGLYALQAIPWVADQFDEIEKLGVTDTIQKYIMSAFWVALCIFIFTSMAMYSANIPDTLGWGTVELEASFGLLNLCFVLVAIQCALCVNSVFALWDKLAVQWVWEDFSAAKWTSARKALYLELTLQLIMYVLLIVQEIDWAVLLIVIAYFYLTSKEPTFMVIYLVLVSISILFDAIHAAELPSFSKMTSGESYGATLWLGIFALKPLIFITIIVIYFVIADVCVARASHVRRTLFDRTIARRSAPAALASRCAIGRRPCCRAVTAASASSGCGPSPVRSTSCPMLS